MVHIFLTSSGLVKGFTKFRIHLFNIKMQCFYFLSYTNKHTGGSGGSVYCLKKHPINRTPVLKNITVKLTAHFVAFKLLLCLCFRQNPKHQKILLSGYGVELAIKSTEYKAVDDTKVKGQLLYIIFWFQLCQSSLNRRLVL